MEVFVFEGDSHMKAGVLGETHVTSRKRFSWSSTLPSKITRKIPTFGFDESVQRLTLRIRTVNVTLEVTPRIHKSDQRLPEYFNCLFPEGVFVDYFDSESFDSLSVVSLGLRSG